MSDVRVVVIGDGLIDELRDDTGVREFVGGAALNVAVGLSRLGVPASLIAMVGDDEAGDHIRAYLRDFGVELIASPAPHGSSRAVSTRSGRGEPEYVFNEAAQRRRIHYGPAERQAMTDADLVVVSCVPLDDVAQTLELTEAVVAAGARLAIDPNPRAGMLSDRAEFVRGFEQLAAHAELVKVGEDDAALLYGTTVDDLRERLVDLGADVVLATYGAAGAAIEAEGDLVTKPVADLPGRIVDTMGAGDAVLAAVVAAILDGAPDDADGWDAVLARAMEVAAATCRFEGALIRLPEALGGLDLDRLGT
jgi:fructokinase